MQIVEVVAWLTGVWDEDERVARAAADDRYTGPGDAGWFAVWCDNEGIALWPNDHKLSSGESVTPGTAYISRQDPAAALARIAADRQILAMYLAYRDAPGRMTDVRVDSWWRALEEVVRLLALPHADRPGYQESWRPAQLP